uniref:Uncharacterized protein n=1 Tax=Anguilla anguilla TaxID=7936 RepID=A0A0E9PKM3_ANGAN
MSSRAASKRFCRLSSVSVCLSLKRCSRICMEGGWMDT